MFPGRARSMAVAVSSVLLQPAASYDSNGDARGGSDREPTDTQTHFPFHSWEQFFNSALHLAKHIDYPTRAAGSGL